MNNRKVHSRRRHNHLQVILIIGRFDPPRRAVLDVLRNEASTLHCAISIEIQGTPPPGEEPRSKSPSSDEGIKTFLASPTVGMIEFISGIVALAISPIAVVPLLSAVWRRWSKKRSTTDSSSLQISSSQSAEPDIVAIRLQMTDRTEAAFQEWLTNPAQLKHYIDEFQQPSPSAKPVQVAFALKSGDTKFRLTCQKAHKITVN